MCNKRKKNKKKKTKKLSQFLKSHISGTREAISLKFGMWGTEVGGSVHSKKSSCFVKAAQSYGDAKIVFSFFLSIYTGVARRLLGPRDTLPCVLMHNDNRAIALHTLYMYVCYELLVTGCS